MPQRVDGTYETKEISLIREINSRGSNNNTDEYYTNCFPEQVSNPIPGSPYPAKTINLIKRSGSAILINALGTGTLRGIYNWKEQNVLFACVGTTCYIYSTLNWAIATSLLTIVGSGTGPVGFCSFLTDVGVPSVIITDGTTLSQISTTYGVTTVSDPDMPVPHLPTPVFFDSYLLLVQANTANCYNSDGNDPTSWDSANFITAEMRPSIVEAIVTMNNYFLLLTQTSIEYFWDAANPTGSPFQRNDTPVKLKGYVGGLSQFGNKVYLVAEEVEGQPDVFVMEDFNMKAIGNDAIRRHLNSVSLANLTGNIVSIDGNDMYVIDSGVLTYFMILDTGYWGLMTFGTETRFPFNEALTVNNANGDTTVFTLQGSNTMYNFDPTLFQDAGVTFPAVIVTDNQQFDTWNQKYMYRLTAYADRPVGGGQMLIQWTDDDYQTYSTPVAVELNQEIPAIRQLGRFRKRAFKLTYTVNNSWRIQRLEVDINTGIH